MRRFAAHAVAALAALCAAVAGAPAAAQTILLGATSTTDNSGLLDHLLPHFEAATGISVRVVVQGTGAILNSAAAGNFDLVLIHEPAAEERFMAAGHGASRMPVMESRFVIVGPAGDPARVSSATSSAEAMRRIAARRAVFVSRADDSGTHVAELRLWRDAGVDPSSASGTWYRETGAGMGATLNIAAALDAYSLTEIASWLSFGNRGELELLFAGAGALFANPYSVILVDPARHPHVKFEAARRLAEWLTGPDGQAAIGAFRIGDEQPFRPTADAGAS